MIPKAFPRLNPAVTFNHSCTSSCSYYYMRILYSPGDQVLRVAMKGTVTKLS